eukprot:TRINITY_DN31986_c0_g1_i1.p1 TRINITY_DN31986_c0_g1~~TRINITY_DN31986_c0_g1_i1.p1  ORF type:complete len:209 (+),score=31.68 TRINITY_DN31986_c0_g1_i1:73-699(+)
MGRCLAGLCLCSFMVEAARQARDVVGAASNAAAVADEAEDDAIPVEAARTSLLQRHAQGSYYSALNVSAEASDPQHGNSTERDNVLPRSINIVPGLRHIQGRRLIQKALKAVGNPEAAHGNASLHAGGVSTRHQAEALVSTDNVPNAHTGSVDDIRRTMTAAKSSATLDVQKHGAHFNLCAGLSLKECMPTANCRWCDSLDANFSDPA